MKSLTILVAKSDGAFRMGSQVLFGRLELKQSVDMLAGTGKDAADIDAPSRWPNKIYDTCPKMHPSTSRNRDFGPGKFPIKKTPINVWSGCLSHGPSQPVMTLLLTPVHFTQIADLKNGRNQRCHTGL